MFTNDESKCELKFGKHTVTNRWAFLSNVFMSFSSGKYGLRLLRRKVRFETVCFPIFNTFPIAKKSFQNVNICAMFTNKELLIIPCNEMFTSMKVQIFVQCLHGSSAHHTGQWGVYKHQGSVAELSIEMMRWLETAGSQNQILKEKKKKERKRNTVQTQWLQNTDSRARWLL